MKHTVCVCVFTSHPFWTSMDVPAGVTQEEGHTGFLIHLPSAVRALIFVASRILYSRRRQINTGTKFEVSHLHNIFVDIGQSGPSMD